MYVDMLIVIAMHCVIVRVGWIIFCVYPSVLQHDPWGLSDIAWKWIFACVGFIVYMMVVVILAVIFDRDEIKDF